MRISSVIAIWLAAWALASCAATPPPPSGEPPLTAYEGRYDAGGQPLYLVSDGDQLVAVIGLATYPMRREGGDRFLNAADQNVSFERDASGAIVAAQDGNGRYPRLGPDVPQRIRLLMHPRPADAGPWRYSIPRAEADIATADAAGMGVPHTALSEALRRITSDPAYADMHSLLIYRRGHLVLEEYFYGFDADEPHDLRSATKSIHAALAGIAVREGLLRLDTPVWAELADHYRIDISPELRRVTLADVLDMRTGFACDDYDDASPGRETEAQRASDWVEFLLRLPAAANAPDVGRYCSMAVVAVGRLIEIRSGERLLDYATPRLFTSLGIDRQRLSWDFSPTWQGDTHAAQIFLTPRDMLRFGRLYLEDGVAGGWRILPAGWAEASFDATTAVGSWRRYSRFWWSWDVAVPGAGAAQNITVHAAMGNGGQRIVVVPELDMIIVMTGGNYNDRDPTRLLIEFLVQAIAEAA